MAQLPSRQFIALDTLVARARAPSANRSIKSVAPRQPRRTLAEIERASSLNATDASAPLFVRPPTPPSALAMWVLVATCANCGRVYRLPPQSVLIKYGENEHSFHFKRDDAAIASLPPTLPREVREKAISIPFCEACFRCGEAAPISVEGNVSNGNT